MMQGIQEALGNDILQKIKQRLSTVQTTYSPAYFREQLPELEDMGATDDMIAHSKIPLYERLKQLKECAGCTGYPSCKRPPGMEGTVIRLFPVLPDEENTTAAAYISSCHGTCNEYSHYLREQHWAKLQEFSGKAKQDSYYTFENFPIGPKRQNKDICTAFYDFANNYKPGDETKGIYLHGRAGTFKTWLMLAMVNRLEERRVPVLFIRTDSIFRNFKAYLSRKEEIGPIIERYASVEVLAIDEFAQESPTDFTVDIMFELLNARFTNGLPTFYTSNYAPDNVYMKVVKKLQLEEKVEAIHRRISQGARLAEMIGDSWKLRDVERIGPDSHKS
ncbi:AFG1/ZapE family ATPase [Paenibacillus tyrfis]|uniref:ATPase AAA n=1 Tax=Paenibacillus tyrfis TaxID=1501230 RepID=A0A081NY91_9BACL|nr:AFG1/ZapE family ATPase [Paenibacillus tyrfis]KEQ23414.1 hypothetical protein ET33_16410 [Paenibacillus tyrfis]